MLFRLGHSAIAKFPGRPQRVSTISVRLYRLQYILKQQDMQNIALSLSNSGYIGLSPIISLIYLLTKTMAAHNISLEN